MGPLCLRAIASPVNGHSAARHRISYERGRLCVLTAIKVGIACALHWVDGTYLPYDARGGSGTRRVAGVGCAVNDNLMDITMGSDISGREKESEDGFHRVEP